MTNSVHHVAVSIPNSELRSVIIEILQKTGFTPVIITSWYEFLRADLIYEFAIIDTNDDVAALCQVVYELYRKSKAKAALPIFALLSRAAQLNNPSLEFWLVDGHAAIFSLLTADDPELLLSVTAWARHLYKAILEQQDGAN